MANSIPVRIVQLQPMTVASFPAYGSSPEKEAWEKLVSWARPLGLLEQPDQHPIFGFDTLGPSPASENRGYEFWIELEPGFKEGGEVKIKSFSGGRYAIHRIPKVGNPWETIPQAWKALVLWQEDSPYKMGKGQCLEHHLGPVDAPLAETAMDLYLSIE